MLPVLELIPFRPVELTKTIEIPDDIELGEYYIIAQIDLGGIEDLGTILEVNETNNQAVWNRKVDVIATPSSCAASSSDCNTAGSPRTSAVPLLASEML